jgi:hypothetical protein
MYIDPCALYLHVSRSHGALYYRFGNGKKIADVSQHLMVDLIHEFIELFQEALVLESADI